MDFLISAVTGFLSAYLALTNSMADGLERLVLHESKSAESNITKEEYSPDNGLVKVDSNYEKGGLIPSILIENAAYQKASLVEAEIMRNSFTTPKEAIVNIFCTYKTETQIQTTTGTGFFIDSDGIIMTNAHVAQLLLLADIYDEDGQCVVRTGSPATPKYTADLLYIPPAWLRDYASMINSENPKGTGERDYALLYVNGALNNKPIPGHFPALNFNSELMRISAKDSEVTVAGYPAEILSTEGAEAILMPQVSTTTITDMMTFGSNYADLIAIGGTIVGEQGASGGPIVNEDGEVISVITTRGNDDKDGEGSLRAITISYIDRTIKEETGFSLRQNLGGDLPYRAKLYKDTMVPFLSYYLKWGMEKD